VLRLEIASGVFVHRLRIGRHDGDAARSERSDRAADGLRRRDGGDTGAGTHPFRDDVVVVVGEQARRRLGEDDHLDPGRAQQAGLIVDVLVTARRETTAAARHEASDVGLVRRRQEAALELDRRVRGWNQHAEMSHRWRSRYTSATDRPDAADRSIASISVWRRTARSKPTSNDPPPRSAPAARAYAWATLYGGPAGVPLGADRYLSGTGMTAMASLPRPACIWFGPWLSAPLARMTIAPSRP